MLGALHEAYGENDVTFQGPVPTAIIANVNTQHSLDIQYNHGQVQLTVKNTLGFEVSSVFFCKSLSCSCSPPSIPFPTQPQPLPPSPSPSSSTPSSPRSDELRTQKLKFHLLRTQSLKVLTLKAGVRQYIAIYAMLTARNFFLANFYPSGPFTCIFPKPLPSLYCVR